MKVLVKKKRRNNIVITVAGKRFFCRRGCNVFNNPTNDAKLYECNSCKVQYKGE
jgi:hypothetical protein